MEAQKHGEYERAIEKYENMRITFLSLKFQKKIRSMGRGNIQRDDLKYVPGLAIDTCQEAQYFPSRNFQK